MSSNVQNSPESRAQWAKNHIDGVRNGLRDLLRLGAESPEFRDVKYWRQLAGSATGARAPEIQRLLLECIPYVESGESGYDSIARRLGQIALILDAFEKKDLPFAQEMEARLAIGCEPSEKKVLSSKSAEKADGVWIALGGVTVLYGRRAMRRDWFLNSETHRIAMFRQQASRKRKPGAATPFAENFRVFEGYRGTLRFWPGVLKFRAAWESRERAQGAEPGGYWRIPDDAGTDLAKFHNNAMKLMAQAPWTDAIPALLSDVVLRQRTDEDGVVRWYVVDANGKALRARGSAKGMEESFKAATFATPAKIFAEWNGRELVLLSICENRS